MNASERKALALLQERAASGPWTATHADAAIACGLPERTWRRVVGSLAESGLVSVYRGKHAVLFAVANGHSSDSRTAKNGHERPTTAMNGQTRTAMNGHSPRAVSSVVVDDVSKEETTTSATTAVVEQTARDENGHSRTAMNGQERPFENGQERPLSPNARAELLDLYRLALDQAEELGRVKAERDSLRVALAAHTEDSCPSLALRPPRSTPAPSAGTRESATASPATALTPVLRSSNTSCGSTSTPTAIGTVQASAPVPSANPSPRPVEATVHLANSRAEVPLGPEPEDVDRDEDVRAFREIVASPHSSELEVEAQLARALSYGVRLHQAVASVAIATAEGGHLEHPARFAWAVINGKALPSPGSSKTWAELRSTVLPALRAEAARKAAGKAARGDSGGAHRVEHVSRPLQKNPVQQRQDEIRARQAARYLAETKAALAREAAGGTRT